MHLSYGARCELSLQGYGLESSNSLAVISAGECGDADVEVVEIVRGNNITANTTQAKYFLANFTTGAASFLPGDMYKLCWAHEATVIGAFAVEIDASMELVGPYRTDVACTQGQPCELSLQGYGLASSNSLVPRVDLIGIAQR